MHKPHKRRIQSISLTEGSHANISYKLVAKAFRLTLLEPAYCPLILVRALKPIQQLCALCDLRALARKKTVLALFLIPHSL